MFEKMKKEVDSSRAKVDEMQNELSAWKFTPDRYWPPKLVALEQWSPIGGGGTTPSPPGEGRKNLVKWLNQGFFSKFFLLIVFRMVWMIKQGLVQGYSQRL